MAEVSILIKAPTAGELSAMGTSAIKQWLSDLNANIQPWLDANNNGEPLTPADIDALTGGQKTLAMQVIVQAAIQRAAGNWDRNEARNAAGDAVQDPGTVDDTI